MVLVTAFPWLDPTSLDEPGRRMAVILIVAGYGLLLLLASLIVIGFLPEMVTNRL